MINYAAGFFDAEGSIWFGKGGACNILRATYAQQDPTIHIYLQKHLGGSINLTYGKLSFNGQKAVDLLNQLKPFLIVKKYEVLLGLSLHESRKMPDSVDKWKDRIRYAECNHPDSEEGFSEYLAGFLDGDGYIQEEPHQIHIGISQMVELPLIMAKERYGGNIYKRKDGVYQWRLWCNQAKTFLDDVGPHLLHPRFHKVKYLAKAHDHEQLS